MSSGSAGRGADAPDWLAGQGLSPTIRWRFGTDGALSAMRLARESGDLFVSDQSGALYRIGRDGQILALTRLQQPVSQLAWSDDGQLGAAVVGSSQLLRFDGSLQIVQRIQLPETCLALNCAPFGHHLAASLASGSTLIFNERKRRIAQFETLRPLAFLQFCHREPILFGAAEHGLVCCHNLAGAEIWQQRNWANVGDLAATGDGDLIYLASFAHGIQTLDGDGASVGSYVLEGTVKRIDASFEPQRLIASTIERALHWLDADGELLWSTLLPDDTIRVICDPLGTGIICGLSQAGIYRLDWGGTV